MNAADAYAAGFTGKGVTVGVVDSGFYADSPELSGGRIKPLTTRGVFGSSGYFSAGSDGQALQWGIPADGVNAFSKGAPFNVPGTYDPRYNDTHGTHVTGIIAATRDGTGMHGVAFDSNVYVSNSGYSDVAIYGSNIDYNYIYTAYSNLGAAGARIINSSWGSAPPGASYNTVNDLIQAYAGFEGKKGYLDALSDVTHQYGAIEVFAAGNTASANSNVRSSLPYFRPDLEKYWLAVGAYGQSAGGSGNAQNVEIASFSNKAGIDKYWYVTAPGVNVLSTVTPDIDASGYHQESGTSMAAPMATGALAIIMQRFGYLSNTAARDVLLTTATHRDAVSGTPDANGNAPNAVWGWGVIDLNKAMKGPGQFLGAFVASMPKGTVDTWSNNISEDALIQRSGENQQEAAAWAARKAALQNQLTPSGIMAAQTSVPAALNVLVAGLGSADYQSAVSAIEAQAGNDLVLGYIYKKLINSNIYWNYIDDPAYRQAAAFTLQQQMSNLTAQNFQDAVTAVRPLTDQIIAVEETRSAAFAGIPTRGSLVKLGLGTLTLSGANTFSGGVTLGGGTLSVSQEANLGAPAGGLTFDGGLLQVTGTAFTATARPITWAPGGGGFDIADPANTFTVAQALAGPGGLAKLGAGTLALAGANTYAGPTLIAVGTLEARGGQAIGDLSAVTVAAGATVALRDGETVGSLAGAGSVALGSARLTAGGNDASTVFAGTLSGTGGLNKAGLGTMTLTGTNTYTGGTAILAGTLQIGAGGTAGAILGDVANAGTLAFNRADAVTFAGTVSGPGDLRQLGTGTLTFTGPQTYTGLTTVAAGTLALTPAASLVSPVLTLAGASLANAGTLTGGLVNGGTTTSSGTIAGGVTNTGTLTATAGQVNGAIRNDAGRFTVTGAVSSDATFANAAGALLSVSGSYSLAGLLTNAGTLAVADGARLTAGSVANAGTLTVAASASVVDALTNTGFVSNAGLYTADATNAPGATLVNTGTFSTVSQPLANAGTLVTTGVLNGGLANSGTVQAAGQLNGAVANTGLIRLTGPTAGIARLTNDGAFDLGTTALIVGSLAGGTATATLGNGRLTVGTDGSSTTYAGQILDGGSATSLTKVGDGVLTLAGDNAFTGPLTVLGGEVSVTGTLVGPSASFGAGSLLTGQATFASLTLGSGSTVSPGTGPGGIGRIAVSGDLGFAPGSVYRADATADGRSDRIVVGGRATLTGGAVQAVADTGSYAPRTRYTILAAQGGVTGQFAGVSANFAFLTPFLSYDPNDVYLTLARNDLDFGAVARTRNQRGAAAAVQAGGVGSPLYDAVATLSAPQARAAFAALSGDAHASLVSTAFATAGLLREAVLDRLRWDAAPGDPERDGARLPAAYTADLPGRPAAVATVPARVLDPRVFALWGQGFGSTGRAGTDGNAAALSRTTGGFVLGVDLHLESGLRLGLAGGYRTTSFATPGTVESGAVDGVFGGLYGDYRAGAVTVRFGALAADDAVALRRLVLFPGFTGTPSARTGGTTLQGFGEVGYRFALGGGPGGAEPDAGVPGWPAAVIEPFAGGAVVSVRRDRFTEQGGPAALGGAGREDTIPVSTVGVRGQAELDLGLGVRVMAHGLLGYRHAFGDVTPTTQLTVLGTGASFATAGLPIDRDALVAEAGLSAEVAPNATLGVSYTGQLGQRAHDNAAKGNITVRF